MKKVIKVNSKVKAKEYSFDELYDELKHYRENKFRIYYYGEYYNIIEKETIESNINLAFYKAFNYYDISLGYVFVTLFDTCLKNEMQMALRKYTKVTSPLLKCEPLEKVNRKDNEEFEREEISYKMDIGRNIVMNNLYKEAIEEIKKLKDKNEFYYNIIVLYFFKGYKSKEICKLLNIDRTRFNYHYNNAIRILRRKIGKRVVRELKNYE